MEGVGVSGNPKIKAVYGEPTAAPVVTAGPTQSYTLGTSKSFSLGSFSDSDHNGPWSVDVDWGDGSTHTTFSISSEGPLGNQTHTYPIGGADSYTITVKVTDQTNLTGQDVFLAVKASSTTTVASSANPSNYGSSVFFTATVSAATGPTGTVQFYVDGTAP